MEALGAPRGGRGAAGDRHRGGDVPAFAPGRAQRRPRTSTQPLVEGFAADREYVLAAEDLERVLAEGRDKLSPATVAVLERNLALIDAAIAEARAALEADPANADLRALLWGAHRQKLDLLDRATRLTRS